MIELKRLKYAYQRGKPIIYPDWSLRQGQHALVSGKTGSGKSTLLNLICGLITIQEGDLIVCDRRISEMKGGEIDKFRGRYIGIVSSAPYFIPNFNLQDNLLLAQSLGSGVEDMERVYILLHEMGLAGNALNYPSELSQSEIRIAAIIRAVINKPRLILADEPTLGLTEKDGEVIFRLLTSQAAYYESTLVLASQDPGIQEIFKNQLKLMNV
jgi:putative ABC transport system ATP-binding protein